MQLCRICTIEDANGINCCACIFQLLGAGNCCIGNSGVEFCPSGGNAIREYDHHFLAIHTATGIGITAAHKGFSRLHTSPDIRCASRVLRQSINCFFQRTLSCGIYHSPALPSLCFTAKSNNRHTVIALFRILFAHFVNEAVDRLLHGILAGIKIFSSFISIEVIRHRAGLIQHQYNIQQFRAGCLRYLIGNIGFQRQFCAITIDGFFHLNRAVFRSGHLRFQFGFFIRRQCAGGQQGPQHHKKQQSRPKASFHVFVPPFLSVQFFRRLPNRCFPCHRHLRITHFLPTSGTRCSTRILSIQV